MDSVHCHSWTANPKGQVKLAKAGQYEFSHPNELPVKLSVKKTGWLCRRIIVTTTEDVWYRDAVSLMAIPAGFTCDLSSTPRPTWCIVAPTDMALEGLFHDLNYRQQQVSRRYADFLFFHMMTIRGVPWYVRYPAWAAVRLFGRKAWDKHAKRNKRNAKHD